MDINTKASQCKKIIEFVKEHGHINPLEAINCLGIMRLAARISDLEKTGIRFEHKLTKGTNRDGQTVRYMEYTRAV